MILVVSIHPPGWYPELQSDCLMQSLPQVTVLFSSAPEQSPRVGSREHSHGKHQAFTWRAKDTHMASIWHSRGEHMAPTWGSTWHPSGERVELTWGGTHMGNTRHSHGEHVHLHREHMSRLWSIVVLKRSPSLSLLRTSRAIEKLPPLRDSPVGTPCPHPCGWTSFCSERAWWVGEASSSHDIF